MEKLASTKEKEIQAIKVDFMTHGINPEIVSKISTWGELRRRKEGFYLNVSNMEEKEIAGFVYHWDDGYLCMVRNLPRDHENKIVVEMHGFQQLSFDSIMNRLYFKASFGKIGKQVAWFNRQGEFRVESSIGKERPLRI